jgi:hypothetical protein
MSATPLAVTAASPVEHSLIVHTAPLTCALADDECRYKEKIRQTLNAQAEM